MPKLVKMKINPSFKPSTPEQKAALTEATDRLSKKALVVPYQTALQNMKFSKGMYAISNEAPEGPPPAAPAFNLDDMKLEDLKVMMLSLGIKTEKQMYKSDVVALIRKKLETVEVVEDDAGEQ